MIFNPKFKSFIPFATEKKKFIIYNFAKDLLSSTTDDVSALYNSASADHVYPTNASTANPPDLDNFLNWQDEFFSSMPAKKPNEVKQYVDYDFDVVMQTSHSTVVSS